MTDPSRPSLPLKILTLNGGGLQAISTLLILNKVLETIAQEKGVLELRKPRPCDVFDTIAGIGVGGWLAILLGRFRMDVTSCLSEWYNMMQRIAPRSMTEELRLRLLQHCYFDTDRVVETVDYLTQFYGTDDRLYAPDPQGARTRHVFVEALTSDAKGYNLFRSYEIPDSAKLPGKLLEGPQKPASFKISHAFAVTGATRYFTTPWKEQLASSGMTEFSDTKFPRPHNITKLALDEMWGMYGMDVPLSVVVNIGPGLPNAVDVKRMARRFSWGLNPFAAHEATTTRRARSPTVSSSQSENMEQGVKELLDHSQYNTAEGSSTVKPVAEGGTDAIQKRLEDDIDNDINAKLTDIQPQNANLYYRLALPKLPQGTPLNDSSAPYATLDATLDYLTDPRVTAKIDGIVKRIPEVVSSC